MLSAGSTRDSHMVMVQSWCHRGTTPMQERIRNQGYAKVIPEMLK